MLDHPIIDAHTHIEGLPGSPWQDPPETILRLLDEAGIAQAVVMTYCDAPLNHPSYDPLAYTHQAILNHPERLIGFARLDPGAKESEALLEHAIQAWGFKGLKLHPFGYRQPVDSPDTMRLLRKAGELGVPVLLHCGDEDYTLPLQLERAARACPDTLLWFGHMGGYFHGQDALDVAKRCPNVILETSATPHVQLIGRAIELLGPERVIFGSDGPGCDPQIERKKIALLGLSENELRCVFYDNVKAMLKL